MNRYSIGHAVAILAIALGIVGLPALVVHDFFFIDDAQSAGIGFAREMGRLWLAGHLPILTTKTLLGGNFLVDMVTAPFTPQTILVSLLSVFIPSMNLVTAIGAYLNTTLVITGGFWLGRILGIRPALSLLLGATAASTPVVLYIFDATWGSVATSYAWTTIAIPALMSLRKRPAPGTFLGAAVPAIFLFSCGGSTHTQIFYLLMSGIIVIVDFLDARSIRKSLVLVSAVASVGLISAIPAVAEFVFNGNYIIRQGAYSNYGGFLTSSWAHVINFFDPFYGMYMLWFGGYGYFPLSIAYCGIVSFVPIFFKEPRYAESLKSPEFRILLSGVGLALLLSFLPSQFGMLRWPFRFLPVFVLMFSALTLYQIEHWPWRKLQGFPVLCWLGISGAWGLQQLFSAEGAVFGRGQLSYFAFFLLLILLCLIGVVGREALDKRVPANPAQAVIWFWLASVLAFAGMVLRTPSLCPDHFRCTKFSDDVLESRPHTDPGYDLQLASRQTFPVPIKLFTSTRQDLESAQFLAINQASINGYSPVGHIGFQAFFPGPDAQGYFDPTGTLGNMTAAVTQESPHTAVYRLFDVRRIYAYTRDLTPELNRRLDAVGLTRRIPLSEGRVRIEAALPSTAEGTLTYQSGAGGVAHLRDDGPRNEWFAVKPDVSTRHLIFNRIIWRGYHAELNGKALPVDSWAGTLVSLVLPPASQGILHLYYEPVSWRYTRFSILAGLLLMAGMAFTLWKPASPQN